MSDFSYANTAGQTTDGRASLPFARRWELACHCGGGFFDLSLAMNLRQKLGELAGLDFPSRAGALFEELVAQQPTPEAIVANTAYYERVFYRLEAAVRGGIEHGYSACCVEWFVRRGVAMQPGLCDDPEFHHRWHVHLSRFEKSRFVCATPAPKAGTNS